MERPLSLISMLGFFLFSAFLASPASAQTDVFTTQPGDTWVALAMRFNVDESELRALNPHFNKARQPVIGSSFTLPEGVSEIAGRLVRRNDGGLLQIAVEYGVSPWTIATQNGLDSPYHPTLYRPLYLAGEGHIRDIPIGFEDLELSTVPAAPGMALGLRGMTTSNEAAIVAQLDGLPISITTAGNHFVGVVGTGAFYTIREPELVIQVGNAPAWIQPYAFEEREWVYQELTLTGEAAQIDQQERDEERARLMELWTQVRQGLAWDGPFLDPVESYLEITAGYGARRSYNGGPYLTYHEGVDFSAYGSTPVLAPAAGTVVLAEQLYVRGGVVIIDHGLGIYTGYYHLSAIHATPGQVVVPGDLLGEVGTTGLSTGNHLHWDLLINGIWVDAAAWQEAGLDCWLLEGLNQNCGHPPVSE